MSKELEIFNDYIKNPFLSYKDKEKYFVIIESALKEYDLMKQVKFIVTDKKVSDDDLEKLKNQRMFISNLEQCKIESLFDEETQKKVKALEIIKAKKVNVYRFYLVQVYKNPLERYNDILFITERNFLTQKEFDLLKEVLL